MASHRIPFETLSAERSRLLAENDRLRQQLREKYRLADLAGSSQAIRRVCELIEQVAPSRRSVCLRGEPGVGKARAARAIHVASTRSAGPFVSVRCAAMPDAEAETQLFGLACGGAGVPAEPGSCAGRASGGTLFFDEFTSLGPIGQQRLLELARDGGWKGPEGELVPLDVRVIAATSSAGEVAAAGLARQELWDHLTALTIPLPPLRERKIDLPILVDLFVEQFAREHVRAVSRVSDRATDMLMNFDWPGNVGQLRRTIERAVVLTTGPVIHHHHLPQEIQGTGATGTAPLLGLSEALDAYEKELLEDALRRTQGVRSQAARLLMTSERVLSYRLRKHEIDSRRFKAS